MRCLLDKVAEQILFDLWRADFPNTTIDEVVAASKKLLLLQGSSFSLFVVFIINKRHKSLY